MTLPTREASATSAAYEPAPAWHTAVLLALYLSVAIAGTVLTARGRATGADAAAHGRLVAVYLPMLIVQCALAFYVVRVGRPRSALASLVGTRWSTARRAFTDVLLAVALAALIRTVEYAWARFSVSAGAHAVAAMLPQTPTERALSVAVSLTVAASEELVFRGYLQRQFAGFTGRASVAVVLQAAVFAVAHAEQGPGAMARIALYGLLFGALAHARKSLLPGVLAHALTDALSGFVR